MLQLVHSGDIVQEVAEDNSSCSPPSLASAWIEYELDAMSRPAVVGNGRQSPLLNSCVGIDEGGSGSMLHLGRWSRVSNMTSGSLAV